MFWLWIITAFLAGLAGGALAGAYIVLQHLLRFPAIAATLRAEFQPWTVYGSDGTTQRCANVADVADLIKQRCIDNDEECGE